MKVLLADDHTLFREGLRSLLERDPAVTIAGETGDGREALELIDRLRPDVAILDISMPSLSGLEVAARAQRASPSTRIVMLSMHAGEAYVAQAVRAGVAAYLLKDSAAAELAQALRSVARGEIYLSPGISKHVVDGFLHGAQGEADPLAALTPRQREILQLIAEGKANKEIAADLKLSVKTVEAHRAQLMDRLGIRDVAGLVRLAIRAGLVPDA
ncbi:MAG TPA: response regulator transcription factor [Candidatus Sulfotelmatobacter sp.]|jgi:DNA-binding NarL/FixJ family response regulator|nr:response regulator transcription factor [Candidatus Sulfotelmatobacter sp.]